MATPKTLFKKIWEAHHVFEAPDEPSILYIDLHLIHEVTSPQAFSGLRERNLQVRRPDRTVATCDHSVPTVDQNKPFVDKVAEKQVKTLAENCREYRIPFYGLENPHQGIVHVIGPEMGLTRPGMTIVCGDSHTSTHGAFGALSFGIGTSEVEQVLATQCLLQHKPKTMAVTVEGKLPAGVTAKDVILAIIAKIGVGGGTGHVIEYRGSAIRSLSMEGRMTLCNMSIEAGARAGMVSPDETTFEYVRQHADFASEETWAQTVARWHQLPTEEGAVFDKEVILQAKELAPMVTYGTNPGMGIPVTACVPDPNDFSGEEKAALEKALRYMGLRPGQPIEGQKVDVVFIGSCTNSRIEDLRAAAAMLRGTKVARDLRVLVVPGSHAVKQQAEAEGLHHIFTAAGCEWREPGCSMCIAMNGDMLQPGQYAASTSNRNFEGRQGKGGRTFLMSPIMAAATAICGVITDVRKLLPTAAR